MTHAQTSDVPATPEVVIGEASGRAERAFSLSLMVSAVRCILAYVVLPFVTPFIGLASGVGPVVGIGIALVALGANAISLRRFWRLRHPWLKPVAVLHFSVMTLLVVLISADISKLVS